MFSLNDCIYGLRNISVGDEEETRIADYLDDLNDCEPELRLKVYALVAEGKYMEAYEAAITPVLEDYSVGEVYEAATIFAEEFCVPETADEDRDEDEAADLFHDIMAEYHRLVPWRKAGE